MNEQTVSAEEVFGLTGWTPVGLALAAVNPELARLLKQEAQHNFPLEHVPAAPDPRLVLFYRNRAAVNESLYYDAEPAEPAAPKVFTERELCRFDLVTLFGPGSDAPKANQIAMRNPELYRKLRSRAVTAGILR